MRASSALVAICVQCAFIASVEGQSSDAGRAEESPFLMGPAPRPKNPSPEALGDRAKCGVAPWPFPAGPDYFTQPTVWVGNAGLGQAGRAQRADLTYSFPPDNTTWFWDNSSGFPNTLNARLEEVFGVDDLDRGREYIRQAIAGWRKYGGLEYSEDSDDGVAWSNSTTHSNARGDIRIGGVSANCSGGTCWWGFNKYPSSGGDMAINTSTTANIFTSTNNYRALRNLVAHEHGHGLGYIHPTPCNQTKVMEPVIHTATDQLRLDDIRGAGRNYGDRLAGNHSVGTARNFGTLTSPSLRSVIERDLSLNGMSGFGTTGQDWFRFTLGTSQNVSITVEPFGDPYPNGQQTSDCEPSSPGSVNPSIAGNLCLELRDTNGIVVHGTACPGQGTAAVIVFSPLGAGTYTIRVIDIGPNLAQHQIVQRYDLTIRVGTAPALPYANAGLNKRIVVNRKCFFMGHVNSRALEPGTTITKYDWDLDGDGTFETINQAAPIHTYSSPGNRTVRLRVTDSNGRTASDSILVTVVDCPTPAITQQPQSIARCVGEGAQFCVTATGAGLSYQWYFNNKQIPGATGLCHTIPSVSLADQGNYQCIVSNPCGQTSSQTATLTVNSCGIIHVSCDAPSNGPGFTWQAAFRDLQDALDAARANPTVSQIWVAKCTYKPDRNTGNRLLSFELVSNVAIYGGFTGNETQLSQRDWLANPTMLEGDLLGDDPPSPIDPSVFHLLDDNTNNIVKVGTATGATLDGFTVRGSWASAFPTMGGGLLNDLGMPVTIANCTFLRHGANRGSCIYSAGSPTITNCIFADNTCGDGGGPALRLLGTGSPKVTQCLFNGSAAWANGGTIYVESGAPTFVNCTFFGGWALGVPSGTGYGGAIFADSPATVTLANSIVWGNGSNTIPGVAGQIHAVPGATVQINHSCIQDWSSVIPGTGSFRGDPRFLNPSGIAPYCNPGPPACWGTIAQSLCLGENSGAIDAGANSAVPAFLTLDLGLCAAPHTRFLEDLGMPNIGAGPSPIVDCGVDEYNATSCYPDCNTNGQITIADFACFQSYFGQADRYADCNGDNNLTIADFGCFQTKFVTGCP